MSDREVAEEITNHIRLYGRIAGDLWSVHAEMDMAAIESIITRAVEAAKVEQEKATLRVILDPDLTEPDVTAWAQSRLDFLKGARSSHE